MAARALRYASGDLSALALNDRHNFAMDHAISIFPINGIYSFIPKNACSSLRWSAAIANGCCSEDDDVNWIHSNNRTFRPSLHYAANARSTFVVLRCPYRRVASAFLNKVVREKFGPKYSLPISRAGRLYRRALGPSYYDSLTFKGFCCMLRKSSRSALDQHWRPQTDFLVYKEYDHYFSLENFKDAIQCLKNINFTVHDTRKLLKHDTSHFSELSGKYSDYTVAGLREMVAGGDIPSHASLYDSDCINLIQELYFEDLQLYSEKFGRDILLFH